MEWMVSTIACAAVVVTVQVSIALLSPWFSPGPAMCVTASWMGLAVSVVAARWPGRELVAEEEP